MTAPSKSAARLWLVVAYAVGAIWFATMCGMVAYDNHLRQVGAETISAESGRLYAVELKPRVFVTWEEYQNHRGLWFCTILLFVCGLFPSYKYGKATGRLK